MTQTKEIEDTSSAHHKYPIDLRTLEKSSNSEIGKKLRDNLGDLVTAMIVTHPEVAIGAVKGALQVYAVSVKNAGGRAASLVAKRSPQMTPVIEAIDDLLEGIAGRHPNHVDTDGVHRGESADDDEVSEEEAEVLLDHFTMSGDFEDIWPDVELLTTTEAAERLGVVQSTVLEWIKKDKVLKLSRKGKRGFRVPAETIGADGEILPGLAKLIKTLARGDHNLAWAFLTDQIEFSDGAYRPIDLLKQGRVDEVLAQKDIWGEQGGG